MEHLSLQLQGHNSPPAQSSSFLSQLEVTATRRTTSQDQSCVSSGSEESHVKQLAAPIKPMFFIGNPDFSVSPSQCEMSQSAIHSQYNYSDPYYSGLFPAYGPQPFPQMVGAAPARVPLPIDVAADDGPIYVNAKQYHGILRRRQIRAKLEAQNKLVKNRRLRGLEDQVAVSLAQRSWCCKVLLLLPLILFCSSTVPLLRTS
ncbi:unnamed protein product [Cuscuta europaea]|uniref:Nuclear transcription factor Y subunit n=1 Tax=Cuscuta europaea TaxID=41803 RepID=A0A9P0ZFR0_CUSEU|nr:unnamed protein product [Cuscuta europaea]